MEGYVSGRGFSRAERRGESRGFSRGPDILLEPMSVEIADTAAEAASAWKLFGTPEGVP